MIVLKIQLADDEKKLSFDKTSVTIGRKSDNDITVKDKKVSRVHARIERTEGLYRIFDLNSSNGTSLNGKSIPNGNLNVGDVITVGPAEIAVVEMDIQADTKPPSHESEFQTRTEEDPHAIPESNPLAAPLAYIPKSSRPNTRRWITLASAVLILGGGGYLIWQLGNQPEEKTPPMVDHNTPEQPDDRTEDAIRALADLREKVAAVEAVSPELLDSCSLLAKEFAPSFQDSDVGGNPFDTLYNDLILRRENRIAALLANVQSEVTEQLTDSRFDRALQTVAKAEQENEELASDHLRALMARIHETARLSFEQVRQRGERLERARKYKEAARFYTDEIPRFTGTLYHARLVDKPDIMNDQALAEKTALARVQDELKQKWEPKKTASQPENKTPNHPSGSTLSPLQMLALQAMEAGTIKDAKLSAEDLAKASPEILFSLYEKMGASGDDLLSVCEYGYVHKFTAGADALLHNFIGTDRREKKTKADELLARVRGESLPANGYTWNRKLETFESPAQITNREARKEIHELVAKLARATSVSNLDKTFESVQAYYEDPNLSGETRELVRSKSIAALNENKKNRLADLTRKTKNSSIGKQLRPLKLELNRRREAALKLIYDESVYLREDHPDWTKGDKINGQENVDDLVHAVREIWDRPGSAVMDAAIRKTVTQIQSINKKYLKAFGETTAGDDLKDYQEIVNNLDTAARLSIRSFSLNAAEQGIYTWNRRVEKYNAALRDSDVTKDIKEHVKVVNEYREMMGRKRCFIDARLCRATTKHSAECDKAGRIWHNGPDGTPQTRAKAEGFSAGVGENVAIGYANPAEIWNRGWYRASDHHRNGLRENWNCIGYGYVGRVGTQNFANIGTPKGF